MYRIPLTAFLATLLIAASGCASKAIRTVDLLEEMTDLRRLAELPSPAYRTVQYSSFDRRSNEPGGRGWFENADGFGGEPVPGFEAVVREPGPDGVGEYLICDVASPGAIVRTWTALIKGDIHVYLDGSSTPLYSGPAEEFLWTPYAAIEGTKGDESFIPARLQKQMYAGYCPIPFAKRCRITWTGNLKDPHFYHITLRLYEPGTAVERFQPLPRLKSRITKEQLARLMLIPARLETTMALNADLFDLIRTDDPTVGPAENRSPSAVEHPLAATVAPHTSAEILKLEGPRLINELRLRVKAADMDRALRQTLLTIHTEGRTWGDVQAPIGDFFGAAPGVNPYQSLPFEVARNGMMTCRFPMPFEKSIRIVIENRGEQDVTVNGYTNDEPYTWTDRSMHFRARWRVDHDLVGSHDQPQDLPFLLAGGQGRYVGTAVMLLNPCRLSTSWGNWWGEGDEKIFVDDDRVPSTFGTGSEDYFNYAWSLPDIFETAYCAQPRNDGYGNRGFVSNVRWHILDDIPFNERIAFFMELFPHTRVPGMSYARISYYYARPGTYDDHVAIQDADLRHLELAANLVPAPEFMLKGAVFHEIETLLPAELSPAFEAGPLWSGGKHVKFDGSKGPMKLRLPIEKDGNYELYFACARTPTSAVADVTIDGNPVVFSDDATSLKLFVPVRTLAREFVTKKLGLTAGEHAIEIKTRPQPEVSGMGVTPGDAIGLDYIAVKPVK